MKTELLLNVITVAAVCLYTVGVCVANVNHDRDDATSGVCGSEVGWFYDTTTNILTINGTGGMDSFISETYVPWYSFKESIKSVVIEDDVKSIGDYAFYGATSMTSITIPDSVVTIGLSVFQNCRSLSSITIPAKVRRMSLYGNSFVWCSSLTEIKVDPSNTNFKDIDGVLFNGDGSTLLTYPGGKRGAFEIPKTVTRIDNSAFEGCMHLTSITIPDGVVTIGHYAFENSSLTSLYIPASATNIGDGPFEECSNLVSIEVNESNPNYKSEDGVLFSKDGTELKQYPGGRKGSYTIPDNVTTIKDYAFQGCKELTSLIIPASVNSVLFNAFRFCENLEVVSYLGLSNPSTVNAFNDCSKLRAICVPLQYQANKFCGRTDICKKESCDEMEDIENHCFFATCESGVWEVKKKGEAVEWEEKQNGCIEYKCDNNTGLRTVSKCASNICADNKCVAEEKKPDGGWMVNITIDNDATLDPNTTRIIESICELTGLEPDKIGDVEVGLGDDGIILWVLAYVADEETADIIVTAVNTLDKGDDCSYGVICFSDNATAMEVNKWVSGADRVNDNILLFTAAILVVVMMML